MPRSALARRSFRDAVDARLVEIEERIRPQLDRYRLDPFAPIEDGLIVFLDLETLEEVRVRELWGHQEEVIRTWIDLDHLAAKGRPRFNNVHEEKSRQMGITWVTAYVIWWAHAFHEVQGLAISLKLPEIDDGGAASTPDSLFGRVRFINDNVPVTYRARLHFRQAPAHILSRVGARSFLVGEGATTDPGRGGKFDYGFIDEAARVPWGEVVHTALTRAIPVGRFYNSTPAGEDNAYYRLRKTRPKGYRFIRHHWSRHPLYGHGQHIAALRPTRDNPNPEPVTQPSKDAEAAASACQLCDNTRTGMLWTPENPLSHRYPGRLTSPWYEAAIRELTDEQVAQELDIDYAGALTARIYPEFSEDLHVLPEIKWEPRIPVELSFDYGVDMTAVGIWQDYPNGFAKIAEFEGPDMIPEKVVAGIKDALERKGMPWRELAPGITRTWLAVGDPAGDARLPNTGRSLTADYALQGIKISSRQHGIARTVVSMKRLLMGIPKRLYVCGVGCPATIEHFKNNRWETDRTGKRKPDAKPQNDRHNHMMRADAYLVTWKWPAPESIDENLRGAVYEVNREGMIDPDIRYDMTH